MSCEDTIKEFDLPCENFSDISFSNAKEKEVNQMFLGEIGSLFEEGEVAICPISEEEVFILKLTKKKDYILEDIIANDIKKTKSMMIVGNKEYFLMDFFFNCVVRSLSTDVQKNNLEWLIFEIIIL